MISKRISIDQLGGELRQLAKRMPERVRRGLQDAALEILPLVQQEIEATTPHKPVDVGTYAASWKRIKTKGGAMVVNTSPQGAWIERGRRKGGVSEEGQKHLADWVKRKGLYLDELANVLAAHRAGTIQLERRGKRGSVRRSAIDEACRRVAFVIARKLAREGYAPRYPLRRALLKSKPKVAAAIARAMKGE